MRHYSAGVYISLCSKFLSVFGETTYLSKAGLLVSHFTYCTHYRLWRQNFVRKICNAFVNQISRIAVFIQNIFQFVNVMIKLDQIVAQTGKFLMATPSFLILTFLLVRGSIT